MVVVVIEEGRGRRAGEKKKALRRLSFGLGLVGDRGIMQAACARMLPARLCVKLMCILCL